MQSVPLQKVPGSWDEPWTIFSLRISNNLNKYPHTTNHSRPSKCWISAKAENLGQDSSWSVQDHWHLRESELRGSGSPGIPAQLLSKAGKFSGISMEWNKNQNQKFQENISWENTERKLKPWGSLGMLLAVETIKSLDFYPKLLLSDRVRLYLTRGFYKLKTFRFFSSKPSLWKVSISPLPSIHFRRKRRKYWRLMGRKCFQTRLTKWTFVGI